MPKIKFGFNLLGLYKYLKKKIMGNNTTNISDYGITILKDFEGLRLKAYTCSAGKWTIGWGHTAGVKKGDEITIEEASKFLLEDLKIKQEYVINKFGTDWEQHEFDALVIFAYNTGFGKNLTKAIKSRKTADISKYWLQYVNVISYETYEEGGDTKKRQVKTRVKGLVYRRHVENRLFNGGCYPEIYERVKAWARTQK